METLQIQLDTSLVEALRQVASVQNRTENEIVKEAITAYVQTQRPLPKGMGQYHSGRQDGSETARDTVRQAVKDGLWP